MGLFKAIGGAMGDVLSDQWREYFYCDAMERDVLVERGYKRKGKRGNNKGGDNIISNGSIISVADGQCMIVVDQGKVVELCAEPGEFVYDTSSEPSIFSGGLGHGLKESFKTIGKRISFGGEAPKEQRVYYFNTKEIMGNRYGTANPVPFRVVDKNIGLDVEIDIRCNGEYSYRITNPMLFYANVCGNVNEVYTRDQIDSQLKTELLTALQPAFARISEMGVRYSSLPAHTMEMAKTLNDLLSEQWGALRGIEIVAFGINSVKASAEDEKRIKDLQMGAVLRNPEMMAAHLGQAQADAMRAAASNTATGPMFAFAGMNMASQAGGMNPANLFAMSAQQKAAQAAAEPAQTAAPALAAGWKCSKCGHGDNRGKFCSECGAPQPAPASAEGWTCPTCGHVNKGKFCPECGARKPAGEPLYKCDKCGWEPRDPHHPPKFCPECGDPFDENDNVAR